MNRDNIVDLSQEKDIKQHAYRFSQSTRTSEEHDYADMMESFIGGTPYSNVEKMKNFPMFTPRQDISKYLARYEVYKQIVNVHGSIIECGCLFGGGLIWMAQLSAIFEPVNTSRKIIGFDTFDGIPDMAVADKGSKSHEAQEGGFRIDSYSTILEAARLFDGNRPIGHIPKIELVRGDACETIPKYINDNPALVVALLILDFDIYEPTKVALKHLATRMPCGAAIIFDQVGNANWPGETQAVLEWVSTLRKPLKLQRFPWTSTMSFCVL